MSLLLSLLLAGPVPAAAQGYGAEVERQDAPDHKQKFQEDPNLPKDQGWRRIGIGGSPYEDATKPDPAPALEPKDVRDNVLTLLTAYLARSGGRWVLTDAKTKRERSLRLAELGELKETQPGRYVGRARFRDKAGAVQAELAAHLGGSRWRILSLEPVGAKGLAAKKKPAAEPAEDVLLEAPDAPKPHMLPPAPPPPDPTPPPSVMPTVEPRR